MSEVLVGCSYCCDCLPCPVGINIPELFRIYNSSLSIGMEAAKRIYDTMEHKADDCLRCGRCEKACTNRIGVSAMMLEIAEEME